MEGYQWEGKGRVGGKIQGISNKSGRYKIDGEVKNNIGKVEVKELICMTHGYELKRGKSMWEAVCKAEGNKGREMGQL